MEVSKNDWKLFRARIGDWQEAYMGRLGKQYFYGRHGQHKCVSLHSFICTKIGTKLSANSVRVYSTLGGIS